MEVNFVLVVLYCYPQYQKEAYTSLQILREHVPHIDFK